jgi:fused signal recognition particle receptor
MFHDLLPIIVIKGALTYMFKWIKRKKNKKSGQEAESPDLDQQTLEAETGEEEEAAPEPPAPEYDVDPSRDNAALIEEEAEGPPADIADVAADAAVFQEDLRESGELEEEEKKRFFGRLRERMHKTRERFTDRMDRLVLGKKVIDADLMDDLEEILITSDLGVRTTRKLLDRVSDKVRRKELRDPEKLRLQIREEIKSILSVPTTPWNPGVHRPSVIMVIGVNGVGKTTTIGKLTKLLKRQGLEVLLVAGDTFRAAAIEQLTLWSERVGAPIIRQKSGSDPSAVAFDAMDAALARKVDVVLLDTAGRMHTKVNLMEELKKIQRVVKKRIADAPHEILLVLDATTGQNALAQARLFRDEIGVTGIVLTKLDGTAKGGVVVAICDELQVPVRYIGIGEAVDDLRPFDPDEFARAIF